MLLRRFLASILLTLSAIPALAGNADKSAFTLPPLFTDNMVLQQQRQVPVWGRGTPDTRVVVAPSWGKATGTVVGHDGRWTCLVQTPKAGGPYRLEIRHGDTTAVLSNVLIGEVWLCSGQSNMEMPLEGWPPSDTIRNSAEEIKGSALSRVRLFTVARTSSTSPESTCAGSWVVCSPTTTPGFSATAYFFGRSLHTRLKVPVGLIHASWGGTPVESWISADSLAKVGEYSEFLRKIAESKDVVKALDQWLLKHPVLSVSERPLDTRWQGLSFDDSSCPEPGYPDSTWREMVLPTVWEQTDLGNFDGTVWFRKHVQIPSEWRGKDLLLELGPVDDMDITYVNGQNVGSHEGEGLWKVERIYRVPGALVRDSILSIAVRVIDFQGGGGIFGNPSQFRIHPDGDSAGVFLAGPWRYLPVAEYRGGKFYVVGAAGEEFQTRPRPPIDFSAYSPTALFNGMISPLVPFALRGAIWYQGESNTENPTMYRRLFPTLIRNWRDVFRSKRMPFYYVQIAPFAYDPPIRSEFLREAQFQTLDVPQSGMAVTLDIGEAHNIHPPNKQDVGKRLALWALAHTYGVTIPCSGPLYKSWKAENGCVVLTFDHAGSGLVLRDGPEGNGFQIAGEDRVFRDAAVTVRGKTLIVSHPEVPQPRAVRYAFSNTPVATLFNRDGLPAPSFRTDTWEQ